jgi:hypothetical protein
MLSLGYEFFGLSEAWETYQTHKLAQEEEWYAITRDIIGKNCWLHALGISGVAFFSRIGQYIDSFDSSTAMASATKAHILSRSGKWQSGGKNPKHNSRLRALQENPRYFELAREHKPLFVDETELQTEESARENILKLSENNLRNLVNARLWKTVWESSEKHLRQLSLLSEN